jgi:hypothetical protein
MAPKMKASKSPKISSKDVTKPGGADGEKEEVTTYEINETAKKKEDAFFKAWVKKREDEGVSLKKRIIGKNKGGSKKTVKKKKKVTIKAPKGGEAGDDVREGEDMEEGEEDEDEGGAAGKRKGKSPSKSKSPKRGVSAPRTESKYSKGFLGISPKDATLRKTRDLKALREL